MPSQNRFSPSSAYCSTKKSSRLHPSIILTTLFNMPHLGYFEAVTFGRNVIFSTISITLFTIFIRQRNLFIKRQTAQYSWTTSQDSTHSTSTQVTTGRTSHRRLLFSNIQQINLASLSSLLSFSFHSATGSYCTLSRHISSRSLVQNGLL